MIKPKPHIAFKRALWLVRIAAFMCVSFGFLSNANQGFAATQLCIPGVPCPTPPGNLNQPQTGPNSAKAEPSAPMPPGDPSEYVACDANFMNQIYGKAFMEAEREVLVGNTAILKPDSVLEYTCFDQQAARIANDAGPLFSESGGLGNTYLDRSIERLVLTSLTQYASDQFGHTYLGGANTTTDNSLSSNVAGVAGVCDFMFSIQYVSKCENFGLNPPFLTFEDTFSPLALETGTDPRIYPQTCNSTHNVTPAIVALAKNENYAFASFDVLETILQTQQGKLPPDVTLSDTCANDIPIPTGITVAHRKYGEDPNGNPITLESYDYKDKFCSNPGCYFDNGGNATESDDQCVK